MERFELRRLEPVPGAREDAVDLDTPAQRGARVLQRLGERHVVCPAPGPCFPPPQVLWVLPHVADGGVARDGREPAPERAVPAREALAQRCKEPEAVFAELAHHTGYHVAALVRALREAAGDPKAPSDALHEGGQHEPESAMVHMITPIHLLTDTSGCVRVRPDMLGDYTLNTISTSSRRDSNQFSFQISSCSRPPSWMPK
jgi:hypothetical protein